MILVQWNSPYDGQLVSQTMTEEQAAKWWEMASQPVRETARFGEPAAEPILSALIERGRVET